MNSRRRIAASKAETIIVPVKTRYLEGVVLRQLMSALGHKRTFCDARGMSALPPKADIRARGWNVRFGPIAGVRLLFSWLDAVGPLFELAWRRRRSAASNAVKTIVNSSIATVASRMSWTCQLYPLASTASPVCPIIQGTM